MEMLRHYFGNNKISRQTEKTGFITGRWPAEHLWRQDASSQWSYYLRGSHIGSNRTPGSNHFFDDSDHCYDKLQEFHSHCTILLLRLAQILFRISFKIQKQIIQTHRQRQFHCRQHLHSRIRPYWPTFQQVSPVTPI